MTNKPLYNDSAIGLSVLIIESDSERRIFLKELCRSRFYLVETVADLQLAGSLHQRCHFDLILIDLDLLQDIEIDQVPDFLQPDSHSDRLLMTAQQDYQTAYYALRLQAQDLILRSSSAEDIQQIIDTWRQHRLRQRAYLSFHTSTTLSSSHAMIGRHPQLQSLKKMLLQIAPSMAHVLIEGESGVGKSLTAAALHRESNRQGLMITAHCRATTQFERELFGEANMAMPDQTNTLGLLVAADQGTLYLKDVANLSLAVQKSLLRVIDQKVTKSVDSTVERAIDIRIIASSSLNLLAEVEAGRFSHELYYRLAAIPLTLPPLRERKADLSLLVHHFSQQFLRRNHRSEVAWVYQDLQPLSNYDWPGNIRELQNLIERSLLLGRPPAKLLQEQQQSIVREEVVSTLPPLEDDISLKEIEKNHILRVLKHHNGNKSSAAKILGISRKTLDRKFKEWYPKPSEI